MYPLWHTLCFDTCSRACLRSESAGDNTCLRLLLREDAPKNAFPRRMDRFGRCSGLCRSLPDLSLLYSALRRRRNGDFAHSGCRRRADRAPFRQTQTGQRQKSGRNSGLCPDRNHCRCGLFSRSRHSLSSALCSAGGDPRRNSRTFSKTTQS